jgi:hypothetical protein
VEQSQQVLEWMAQGEARGKLRAFREMLCGLIETRFGVLPPEVKARVHGLDDVDRLLNAILQVYKVQGPEQLPL